MSDPKRKEASNQLNKNHVADLKSSGLNDDTISASGCYSLDPDQACEILGFSPGCPCLAFPYPGVNGHKGTRYIRLKPDLPYKAPGWPKAGKYLSPAKSTLCKYRVSPV